METFCCIGKISKDDVHYYYDGISRLAPFNLREVDEMTYNDTMELDRIGMPLNADEGEHGRVAYFIISDPNSNAFNFLG